MLKMSELLSTLHLCLFSRTFNVIGKVLKTPYTRSRCGRDRMVIGCTTTYAILSKVVSSNPDDGEVYSMQHYVSLSVICDRTVVLSWYSGFLPQ